MNSGSIPNIDKRTTPTIPIAKPTEKPIKNSLISRAISCAFLLNNLNISYTGCNRYIKITIITKKNK